MKPTLGEILAQKRAGAPVIRAEDEKAKLAADIKQSLDASAPKILPPAPAVRELGEMAASGEQIPMDHPPIDASEEEQRWFNCLHSFAETELGIILEPAPSPYAWIAVQNGKHPAARPILLQRLPLLNRPATRAQPF